MFFSFEKLSFQKFFGWFLIIMLFFIFLVYFTFEAKFKIFGNFVFSPISIREKLSPINITYSNSSKNQSISISNYSDKLNEKSGTIKRIIKVNVTLINLTNYSDKLNEFYAIHERITKLNASMRKISFNECSQVGYGNRLYSLLSSLVIAILTNSSLVVRWKEIESYVDLPIRIFDNNLTLDQGLVKEVYEKKLFQANSAQSWIRTKKIDSLMKTNVPKDALRYLYRGIGPYFMELCSNPNYFYNFTYYNLVKNETINLALEVISNNKSNLIDKQQKILKVGFEVGGNLLNRFWKPIKSIMIDVKMFFEKYFQNNFVIGFQLRYTYINKQDTKKFIDCALQIEREYFLSKNNSIKVNSFKWFIASDSQVEINEILKIYPNKTFTTNQYALGHIVSSRNAFHRTILDVELLSLCNELIVTGGSTFGWVAAMKSLKLPLYINGQNRSEKCLRSSLSEPPSGGKGPYASFR